MKAAIDLYDLYCVVYLRLSYLPFGKKAVGTKWVYSNKKDDGGVVVKNKARLVAQGHRQEEVIDYNEFFAPVAIIEAIRIFLDFASYMGFIVYQIDVKSAFLYGTIDEEVYVSKPPGFVDPKFLNKVCKVVKALYMVKQKEDGIFISQDKYVAEILKKFNFLSVKTASTPIETQKPLVKDKEADDVDVHLYREKTLRFGSCVLVPAFWSLRFVSCDLVLRFGPAFCLKTSCVLPKRRVTFCYSDQETKKEDEEIFLERESRASDYLGFRPIHVTG
uniref:Copia protein n=1 Tax=Tanacetum cinerariifolium TaxID=118510 RepID=A0A6L2LGC1_TANCI|nr:copia protein [Tanacetum cinerariifolium]